METDTETLMKVARMIAGMKIGDNVVKDNHCVLEFKERLYTITNMGNDVVKFAKWTGLESNPPELIYTFEAKFNETAFEIMIKHFNKLYP